MVRLLRLVEGAGVRGISFGVPSGTGTGTGTETRDWVWASVS